MHDDQSIAKIQQIWQIPDESLINGFYEVAAKYNLVVDLRFDASPTDTRKQLFTLTIIRSHNTEVEIEPKHAIAEQMSIRSAFIEGLKWLANQLHEESWLDGFRGIELSPP
jgi:hypothetical protein